MKKLIILVGLLLAACGGGDGYSTRPLPISPPTAATSWEAGPRLQRDYSLGTTITQTADGIAVHIPAGPLSTHYITTNLGNLAGKSRIVLKYRMDIPEGVKLQPASPPGFVGPTWLTVYFQRCGDDWLAMPASLRSGDEVTEAHRWFATFASVQDPKGDGEINVSLDDPGWTAVQTSNAVNNPEGFAKAKADTCRVGFVLGGGDGYGHGIHGPATLIIKEFRVE